MGLFFVRLRATTWEHLRALQAVHDLDVFRHTAKQRADGGYEIDGLLSSEQVEQMRSLGYEVEITADGNQVARERAKEISKQ